METIIQTETRKRGFFGKLFKWSFILFNLLMLFWLFSYWGDIGGLVQDQSSDAGKAGTAIGATLGTSVIVFFWAAGSIILGIFTLLTRGKKVIIQSRKV
jgi:hypothetical protein